LHPILVAGDVAAFRAHMAQWEELVGDSTELRESSEDQTRRTMATLLRRPTQFGLPPWASPEAAPDAQRAEGPRDVPSVEPEAQRDPDAIYQLDMLTGELIPQQHLPKPPATEPTTRRVPRARPRKRSLPDHLAQLVLFPDEELAS